MKEPIRRMKEPIRRRKEVNFSMDDTQVRLIAEQIGRIADQLNARMAAIEVELKHYRELEVERVDGIRLQLDGLRKMSEDHETRLRAVSEGVTQFKLLSSLGGFSSIFSVASVVRTLFIR